MRDERQPWQKIKKSTGQKDTQPQGKTEVRTKFVAEIIQETLSTCVLT